MDLTVSPWFLAESALIGAVIVQFANRALFTAMSAGNPRVIGEVAKIYLAVRSAPPTSLFRWRVGEGLQLFAYDPATDTEKAVPTSFRLDNFSFTFLHWGQRARSVQFAAKRVGYDLAFRVLCFFWFFLGSFVLLSRLALTETWHWAAALPVLVAHQYVCFKSSWIIRWHGAWPYVVTCTGVFLYRQGGVYEPIAACAAGGLFAVSALGMWRMWNDPDPVRRELLNMRARGNPHRIVDSSTRFDDRPGGG